MTRHLLDIDDLSAADLRAVLDAAAEAQPARVLEGRGVACLFEKPSADEPANSSALYPNAW